MASRPSRGHITIGIFSTDKVFRNYIQNDYTLYFMNEGFSSSAKSAQHFAMEHSYKEISLEIRFLNVQNDYILISHSATQDEQLKIKGIVTVTKILLGVSGSS